MKIVVIGGSGLIGSKTVSILQSQGHEVLAASPSSGVDATTGKGLKEALKNAQVVIDVANIKDFDEKVATEFFEKSSRNLAAAEKEAGVKHHVALSIVGTQKLAKSGYFRAKNAQEALIKASGIPYTIVQATQFFEFLNSIAQSAISGETVRLPSVYFQPIAADDVAAILAEVALKPAINKTIEIAGPEKKRFPEFIRNFLKATHDNHTVIADDSAGYFGMEVTENSLVPDKDARLGNISLDNWIKNQTKTHASKN